MGQQVGGQQAGEARVKQPGAFLDPSTRTPLGRTAWTRAGGADGERERSMTQNLNHRNYRRALFTSESACILIKFLIDWNSALTSDWSPGVSGKETICPRRRRDASEWRAQREPTAGGARCHRRAGPPQSRRRKGGSGTNRLERSKITISIHFVVASKFRT